MRIKLSRMQKTILYTIAIMLLTIGYFYIPILIWGFDGLLGSLIMLVVAATGTFLGVNIYEEVS